MQYIATWCVFFTTQRAEVNMNSYKIRCNQNKFLKNGFSFMTVLIILFIIGIIVGVKLIVGYSVISADMSKISKISNAINFYYGKNGAIPGSNSTKMTAAGIYDALKSDNMVIPEDFVLESLKTNLSFIGCNEFIEKDGKAFWEWAPLSLNSKICVTVSPNKVTEDFGVASGAVTPSLMNSYLICQIENSIDDKNLNKGSGRLVRNGVKNAKIETSGNFNCNQYNKESKAIIDTESSSYAFKVY